MQLELHESVKGNAETRVKSAMGGEAVVKQPFSGRSHLPYCGSETESEHYASYGGFYAGDEVSGSLVCMCVI